MSQTIQAIIENGMIRPLGSLQLPDGEQVEVILLRRQDTDPSAVRSVIEKIAEMPSEGSDDSFSGADHDAILYPKTNQ